MTKNIILYTGIGAGMILLGLPAWTLLVPGAAIVSVIAREVIVNRRAA